MIDPTGVLGSVCLIRSSRLVVKTLTSIVELVPRFLEIPDLTLPWIPRLVNPLMMLLVVVLMVMDVSNGGVNRFISILMLLF